MSTTAVTIRDAAARDAAAIADIYAQGIAGRDATFETVPPPAEAFARRIAEGEPLIVAERDGAVAGWASILPYSTRAAYAGVGEYTIYVDGTAQGQGVGRELLERLLVLAGRRGFHKLTSRIFPTNVASLELARRCGFREVGTHRRHARLDGEWRDVVVVEALLGDAAD